MADWKTTVRLGDLHGAREKGDMTIKDVAGALAKRLQKNRFAKDLEDVIARLKKVRSVSSYDSCLSDLYAFGDFNHRIWFDPSRPS